MPVLSVVEGMAVPLSVPINVKHTPATYMASNTRKAAYLREESPFPLCIGMVCSPKSDKQKQKTFA